MTDQAKTAAGSETWTESDEHKLLHLGCGNFEQDCEGFTLALRKIAHLESVLAEQRERAEAAERERDELAEWLKEVEHLLGIKDAADLIKFIDRIIADHNAAERERVLREALREIANGVYTGQEMRQMALNALGVVSTSELKEIPFKL